MATLAFNSDQTEALQDGAEGLVSTEFSGIRRGIGEDESLDFSCYAVLTELGRAENFLTVWKQEVK